MIPYSCRYCPSRPCPVILPPLLPSSFSVVFKRYIVLLSSSQRCPYITTSTTPGLGCCPFSAPSFTPAAATAAAVASSAARAWCSPLFPHICRPPPPPLLAPPHPLPSLQPLDLPRAFSPSHPLFQSLHLLSASFIFPSLLSLRSSFCVLASLLSIIFFPFLSSKPAWRLILTSLTPRYS